MCDIQSMIPSEFQNLKKIRPNPSTHSGISNGSINCKYRLKQQFYKLTSYHRL